MKAGILAAVLSATSLVVPLSAAASNTDPVIFVHGFTGWGPSEMGGYKYWGGINDIVASAGAAKPSWCSSTSCQTMTAVVGPVSSNWDRAVELFYQIKGGCVNYGHHHSNNIQALNSSTGLPDSSAPLLSHIQKLDGQNGAPSKCYPGLYPQWDANHKVHLIGHSQGGQTIRMLDYLLRQGSPADVAEEPALTDESIQSNPFTGGKNWIHSITTVSTPHNGTTLASLVALTQVAQQAISAAAAAANMSGSDPVYDFKLDQWGLSRAAGESWSSYSGRVYNSSVWTTLADFSSWDLLPDGAQAFNNSDSIDPNVYYFSFGTQQTYSAGCTYPDSWLTSTFQPQSGAMGCYTRNDAGHVVINSSWWQNDGVVNTNSMTAPTLGAAPQPYTTYNSSNVRKGVWQFMGVQAWDHMDIVGTLCENNDWAHCDPRQMYNNQVQLLRGLN